MRCRQPGRNTPGAGTEPTGPRRARGDAAGGRVLQGDSAPAAEPRGSTEPPSPAGRLPAAGAGLVAVRCRETLRRVCLRFRSQAEAASVSVDAT